VALEEALEFSEEVTPIEGLFEQAQRHAYRFRVYGAGAEDGGDVVQVLGAPGQNLHRDEVLGGGHWHAQISDRVFLDPGEEEILETGAGQDDVQG
jgi:hypothetical protein